MEDKNNVVISFEKELTMKQTGGSSVEIKRNSKGITEFTIKVYSENPEIARKKASKIYEKLNEEFPGE